MRDGEPPNADRSVWQNRRMAGRELPARMAAMLTLPVFDRLPPPPANPALIAAIEGASEQDDVVVDLAGRGGWVARTALGLGRRALSIETSPLTRLLADVVVRPPD